jgi:hypothetical protein
VGAPSGTVSGMSTEDTTGHEECAPATQDPLSVAELDRLMRAAGLSPAAFDRRAHEDNTRDADD